MDSDNQNPLAPFFTAEPMSGLQLQHVRSQLSLLLGVKVQQTHLAELCGTNQPQMSRWDAALFSDRGRTNLETLASPEARGLTPRPEQPSVLVPYELPEGQQGSPERALWHVANGQAPHVLVRRLTRAFPAVWEPYAKLPR